MMMRNFSVLSSSFLSSCSSPPTRSEQLPPVASKLLHPHRVGCQVSGDSDTPFLSVTLTLYLRVSRTHTHTHTSNLARPSPSPSLSFASSVFFLLSPQQLRSFPPCFALRSWLPSLSPSHKSPEQNPATVCVSQGFFSLSNFVTASCAGGCLILSGASKGKAWRGMEREEAHSKSCSRVDSVLFLPLLPPQIFLSFFSSVWLSVLSSCPNRLSVRPAPPHPAATVNGRRGRKKSKNEWGIGYGGRSDGDDLCVVIADCAAFFFLFLLPLKNCRLCEAASVALA